MIFQYAVLSEVLPKMVECLNEKQTRICLGGLSLALPYGSVNALSQITHIHRNTISSGRQEILSSNGELSTLIKGDNFNFSKIKTDHNCVDSKIGRPRCEKKYPGLIDNIKKIIDGHLYKTDSGEIYCNISLRCIADILKEYNYKISHASAKNILNSLGIKTSKFKASFNGACTLSSSREIAKFDMVVDHFYDQVVRNFNESSAQNTDDFENKYSPFDSVVDNFLGLNYFEPKVYTDFSSIQEEFTPFDAVVDHFFDQYQPEIAPFDKFVDYFFDQDPFGYNVTDEDVELIVAFIASLIRVNEKTMVRRKRRKTKRSKYQWKYSRKTGAGRRETTDKYPHIKLLLCYILEAITYGDPERPLYWSSKSQRKLAEELKKYNIFVSYKTVAGLLWELGYSRRKNRKLEQVGKKHPDADKQMQIIKEKTEKFKEENILIISIDCKKKEILGNYANSGTDYAKTSTKVYDHDFKENNTKTAAPYGIFVENSNEGFVNIGLSKDTPEFAVASVEKWWNEIGSKKYPNTKIIYIKCDGGGSNSSRSNLFKIKLQEFANRADLTLFISHFPPGKSKYNSIERRLFALISNNWRGRPLYDVMTMLSLIRETSSTRGLKVEASVDTKEYQTGLRASKKDLRKTLLVYDDVLGNWNYTIFPESKREEVQQIIDEQWAAIDEKEKLKKKEMKEKKDSSSKEAA